MVLVDSTALELPVFYTSFSEEETLSFGKRFASLLETGSIVALKGPLGAGKTCFIKGIAMGLGIDETVTSPSYTIISEYSGFLPDGKPVPVYHIDAYRLRGNDDFSAIGGEETIFGQGISLIEWYERIEAFVPPQAFKVNIEITGSGKRLISIAAPTSPIGNRIGGLA